MRLWAYSDAVAPQASLRPACVPPRPQSSGRCLLDSSVWAAEMNGLHREPPFRAMNVGSAPWLTLCPLTVCCVCPAGGGPHGRLPAKLLPAAGAIAAAPLPAAGLPLCARLLRAAATAASGKLLADHPV